ncbi:hypothetical protein SLEP1_g242 [Rubroshorea leprosula]|uniref:Uncharacterized protein n=1 Tax=Rubroshorea leprosula TaxID=152421 RepID=A0AAV5H9T3_9ROSI|nr:hypothetical protein SLEP1_g242 [Rubroshorea leprosula]
MNGVFNGQAYISHGIGSSAPPLPLLRRPPSLLENLRHYPRDPPEQTNRSTRYLADCSGGAEIRGMVQRRVGLRLPCAEADRPEAAVKGFVKFSSSILASCIIYE